MKGFHCQPGTGDDVRAVALAICKSRTCEGVSCCQWPANMGRTNCNAKNGGYDDAARAAIAVLSSDVAVGPLNSIQLVALLELLGECAEHVTPELETRIKNVLDYHTEHDTASALAALPSEAIGREWQPIETAPKDGTAVILGFWYQGRFAQYMGFYDPAGWMESSRRYFPSHMQGWFTEWHPLPAGPVVSRPHRGGRS